MPILLFSANDVDTSPRPEQISEALLQTQPQPTLPKTEEVKPLEIFMAYALRDEEPFKIRIEQIVRTLRRQKWKLSYHWSEIAQDSTWIEEDHCNTAHLILLLVSSDFIDTDFCYSDQIKQAVKRHKQNDICVVTPIILRQTSLWKDTPFGDLPYLPKNGKPVNKCDLDEAFDEIAQYIKEKLKTLIYYL